MKIKIMDKRTGRTWYEEFKSPYQMDKRIIKINHSKNLQIVCVWRDEEWNA